MANKITKFDIRTTAESLITSEQWNSLSGEEIANILIKNIPNNTWTDNTINIIDNNAKNGILILITLMMRLHYGWEPDKALSLIHSKNLNNPYGFHANVLAFLDVLNKDYDDDTVLDICLRNLE